MVFWQAMVRTEISSTILATEGQKGVCSAFLTFHFGAHFDDKMLMHNALCVSVQNNFKPSEFQVVKCLKAAMTTIV